MNPSRFENANFPTACRRENIRAYAARCIKECGISSNYEIRYGYSICVGEYAEITVRMYGRIFTRVMSGFEPTVFEADIATAVREIALEIDKLFNLGGVTDEFTAGTGGS